MATRTISTRVAVEGESQYRAAITGINAELRNMQSALKMTESQYKNNATSTEALTAKGKALNDLLVSQKSKVSALEAGLKNAQEAERQYAQRKAELSKKIEDNVKALDELKKKSGDTSAEEKKLTEENERLNAELKKNEDYLTAAKKAVNNWQTDLNKARTAVNETEDAIRQNSAALDNNKSKVQGNTDAINGLAQALAASGLKQSIREIVEALTECVDASVEFESAMAGVAKTTDLTDKELSTMGGQIKELSTDIPITAKELAGIVETAGQLGIEKESLVSFATVMADLGVATNLTSEEAATMLARFANVTGMAPELYENLGSVIVDLGNSFATTESEIVNMGQRLAAAGKLAGLTEPEIMALATAMSSVGIEAEAGGTAMTQTLTAIEKAVAEGGDSLAQFADVSGMSAEQFAAAWQNDPITAIQAFIEGLGKLDEKGESATLVLDEMGLSGIRQSNMLKSLATASGLLSNAVDTANTAWAENTALMKEASTRYATTESKITMFENSVNNLKIAIGDQLTPAIADLATKGTDIVKWATDFVQANDWLVPTITALTAGLTSFTTVLASYMAITKVVIPIIKAFNAVLMGNPALAVATAVITLVSAIAALAAATPSATKEADALNDTLDDCNKAFEDARKNFTETSEEIEATSIVIAKHIDRLDELNSKTALTKEEQAEYNSIVSRLRELLPDVNIQMDETTGRLQTTTEELRLGAQAWKEYAQEQAFATIISEQEAALTELQVALAKARIELTKYNESATQGTLDFVAAANEQKAAQQALSEALIESKGKETEAVIAARDAEADASMKVSELWANLSEEEAKAAEAMLALQDSIAETSAKVDEQANILTETQTMVDSYKESLTGAAETSQQMAESISDANETLSTLGDGAGESIAQVPEATATAMAETKAQVDSAKPEITATVTDMGLQAATGYQEQLSNMVDTTTQVLSDVNQTVSGYASSAYNAGYGIGAAISQGAAVGVRAYAAQVAAEAAAMVRNAIAAAKQAAQSNSPSKKTIALGNDLGKGLIIGIREMEDAVAEEMRDTMKKIVDVQIEVPEIPDNTTAILKAIGSVPSTDDRLLAEIDKLANAKNRQINMNLTQNIYADDTSYAGQQREAKRNLRQIARELNR